MGMPEIAIALERVATALHRRPDMGMHDDAPALARWEGGTRITALHANGESVTTDMPCELGGEGRSVTPGWLLRAGFAACTATCIGMAAAAAGIELRSLEVRARSRSDTRGLLGMAENGGREVGAGPRDLRMDVRISAPGVPAEKLRALVETSYRRSPMARAVEDANPVDLEITVSD